MANHMETTVEIENLTKAGADYLRELFKSEDNNEIWHSQLAMRMYGLTEEQIESPEYGRDWYIDKFGAKWMEVWTNDISDEAASFSITSAWSVPVDFLEELVWRLNNAQGTKNVLASGTYMDESYNPCGVFALAHQSSDVEDIFDDEDIDYDRLNEDFDDYNDEIGDKLQEELATIKAYAISYIEQLND
jgi:hypothetical protein